MQNCLSSPSRKGSEREDDHANWHENAMNCYSKHMPFGWLIKRPLWSSLRHVSSFMQDAWRCLSKSKPALNRKVRGGPRPDEPLFGDYATVRRGGAYEREDMTWCRCVIQQLEQTLTNQCQDCQ